MPHPERSASVSARGFTLVELAIVLGVVGLVLATIWGVAARVWSNAKMARTQDQVLTIVQNIRDYYGPSGITWFTSDGVEITNTLNGLGLIPTEMRQTRTSTTSLIHHAMGTYANGSFRVFAKTGRIVRISLYGLTQEECINFLIRTPVLTSEVGISRIGTTSSYANVNVANPTDPGSGITLPLNLTTALSWCPITTADNEVDLDFKVLN